MVSSLPLNQQRVGPDVISLIQEWHIIGSFSITHIANNSRDWAALAHSIMAALVCPHYM